MRLAQLHDKMAAGRELPKHAPTPSPRSPNNSTDGLLPAVCEIREVSVLSVYRWTCYRMWEKRQIIFYISLQ